MNKTGKGGFGERKHHINKKGRPKSFADLRALAQTIAHKELKDGVTVTEAILTGWAGSKNPKLQIQFMEVAYGKVPTPVEVSGPDGKDIPIAVVQPGYMDKLK